jgi:hypothetical protein
VSKELNDDLVLEAIREHSRRGTPELGARLKKAWEAGEDIPSELLDFSGIKSEKENKGILELPPRTGPGSGKKAWTEFAVSVSDLDSAVLDKMNRDEIIEILEARGIIPGPGEGGEEGKSE